VSGWRVARIAGIDVRVDPSFLLVALLIGSNVYTALIQPLRYPALTSGQAFTLAGVAVVLFFLSILGHELAHAGMSRARDIPVAGIVIYMFGGATYTAAEDRGPVDEFLTTVVGPLTSAAIGALLLFIHAQVALSEGLDGVIGSLGRLNVALAIFNVIPSFPLDGGRLLRSAIWRVTGNKYLATQIAARTGQVLAAAMIAFAVVRAAQDQDLWWLWLAFIASMLFRSAGATLSDANRRRALESATAAQVMSPPPPAVAADLSVGEAIARYLSGHEGEAFPVLSDGAVVGFVSLSTVQGVPLDRPVLAAAVAPTAVVTVSATDRMDEVVRRLQQDHVAAVLVMDQGRLVGVIEAGDVNRFLASRS
jgi:Zn-dependent protease/CBS domain-containing protein